MSDKSLTVIGATGYLSVPIVKRLNQRGVKIKAIVRDLSKAKELLPASVELVQGDVESVASLTQALKGTENLYIHLNTTTLDDSLPFYQEREGIQNIVTAAKENGIKQIMQIGGIDSLKKEFNLKGEYLKTNVIRDQGMDYIKASGIAYTFFHCSFFLDSFPLYLQEGVFNVVGQLDQYPLWFINTTDYADTIYAAIGNPEAFNKAYAVQGADSTDFKSAAEKFVSKFDPSAKVEQHSKEVIPMMGFPEEEAAFMEHIATVVEQLKEDFVAQDTWSQLHKPTMSIEEFSQSLVQSS